MAVLANGGTDSPAITSRVVTRPSASRTGTVTGTSGATAPRISRWTSASGITGRSDEAAPAHDLDDHRLDVRREVGPVERELEVRPQEVDLHTGVVATPREPAPDDRLLLQQQADGVGELELAAGPRLDAVERVEDGGTEDVTANHGEVGRCVLRFRLLEHRPQPEHVPVDRVDHRAPVRRDLVRFDLEQRDDRRRLAIVDLDHAAQKSGVVDHHVVAQQHGEGLVPDVLPGYRHRVAEAEWLVLADEVEVGELGECLHLLQEVVLALLLEHRLQLGLAVEVVLDRSFAAAVHHEDVADAGADRLFDDVLDGRAVDDGQHLFGDALARRQEARPQPGGGDHGLAHRGHHSETLPPGGSGPSPCSSPRTRRRRFGTCRARITSESPEVTRMSPHELPVTATSTGNATVITIDATDAFLNPRAITNHRSASPSAISG